jgi:L-fuculose-phosphate aldolase
MLQMVGFLRILTLSLPEAGERQLRLLLSERLDNRRFIMDISAIRQIIDVGKRLEAKGLVNTYEGNISIKRDGLIYMTPTTKNKATLTEEMIAVVNEKGEQVGGNFAPSSECPMHINTYPMRADIGGVIHCHAPYLTAHALTGFPVESKAYPEMMGIFKKIEVVPYGRPGTNAIFVGVKPLLQNRDIVLLGNHGVLAVGKTLEDAYNTVEAAEAIAKVLFIASMMGKPVDLSDDECQMFLNK